MLLTLFLFLIFLARFFDQEPQFIFNIYSTQLFARALSHPLALNLRSNRLRLYSIYPPPILSIGIVVIFAAVAPSNRMGQHVFCFCILFLLLLVFVFTL